MRDGGVQIGYNWQASPRWLAGFEADFQGTNQDQASCAPVACYNQTAPASTTDVFNHVQHKLDYFGTIRGRVGAVNDNVLYYVTGGAAFGHFSQTALLHQTGFGDVSVGTTSDLIGYVVGGGIEAALGGGWSTKAEYLFMDFGNVTTTLTVSPSTLITTGTVRDHIARVGTNYRF